MTRVELPRGGQVFIQGVALGVMRAEVVGEASYAQVLARWLDHDDLCTLRDDQPARLAGGQTLTLVSVTPTPEGESRVTLELTSEHNDQE